MMEDRGHNGYRGDLNRNCMTIAEVLKPNVIDVMLQANGM